MNDMAERKNQEDEEEQLAAKAKSSDLPKKKKGPKLTINTFNT